MVTGTLPFAGSAENGGRREESGESSQLRAAISRGFTRKQHTALVCVSSGKIGNIFFIGYTVGYVEGTL